uniref:Uncharacterized protein n=1 Tax=Xenopus tropicalis TaxID=8364 RepID=A0A1B8Y6V4_XENTR
MPSMPSYYVFCFSFLCRLIDNEHNWYNNWEGEKFEKGQIRNSASNSNNGSQSSSFANREFRPALDKVDTSVKIRTARATVVH